MRWLLLPVFRDLSDISGLPLQVPTSPETPGLNFVRGGLLFTQLSNTSDKPADISSTTKLPPGEGTRRTGLRALVCAKVH